MYNGRSAPPGCVVELELVIRSTASWTLDKVKTLEFNYISPLRERCRGVNLSVRRWRRGRKALLRAPGEVNQPIRGGQGELERLLNRRRNHLGELSRRVP
jgi:hypothetical protein